MNIVNEQRVTPGRELTEAVEQQAATSEILRVISRSRGDVQPVFDTIVEHALRLCEASFAFVMLHHDGMLSLVAKTGCSPQFADYLAAGFEANRETATGRAALERRPVQIIDFMAEPGLRITPAHRSESVRTILAVPMVCHEHLLGVVVTWRREVQAFTQRQIELLHTFADQAVIALENARLIRELQIRNRELTETLEQQAATSAILRAISQSPTDVQPVFDTIAEAAMRLCHTRSANVFTFDGELVHAAAIHVDDPAGVEMIGRAFPRPPDRGTAASRAVLTRSLIAIHDVSKDPDYALEQAPEWGFRSVLGIPLLRDGVPIGAMALGRSEPGPFPEKQIALMQTFADQAVIAIENVRLFRALEEKSRQLEIASRHKSTFLANMSHELRTPLNAIIGFTRIVMRRSQEHLEPKQYENLEKILSSGQNLLSLINAILDLAKVEAGHVEISAREIDPGALLEDCTRLVEPLIGERVKLVRAFAGPLPRILVDEEKLRQIVMNLLSNAARFTERGSIRVRAHSADRSIEISVIDTGIGIAPDKLERIFEEFEQANASSTRAHGGTGLGLTIARRLARLMGGDIHVESAPGAGSTFTLALPIRYAPLP
jgi:signal transduction histidine kinase